MPAYSLEALTVALGMFLLLAEAFSSKKSKAWIGVLAAIGLTGILVACCTISPAAELKAAWTSWPLASFYQFDSIARFYKIIALVCTIGVVLMSVDFRKVLSKFTEQPNSEAGTGEFYALPVFACAGMMWMASAKDLAGAFVALELVTITFYILVAYLRRNVGSLEAGVKYLILGALSTGFLVYGIAWIYGTTGTMSLEALPSALSTLNPQLTTPLLFGIALVLVALGFKVGAVPMQMWIPDVYQGAPTPTTAFLSVGSKAAGFALLIRFLTPFLADASPVRNQVLSILLILSIATLLFGNLAAIGQANFKRLLAYSSIAHAGFLLLALAAWQPASSGIVSFYLATYLIMTLGAFFVLAQVRVAKDGEAIADFNGLGKTNPGLALALTVLLAALAGVPLTAGFWGKFFVFQAAISKGLWLAVAVAALGAAAGFYYYFKTIRAMWWQPAAEGATAIPLPIITRVAVIVFTVASIVIGVLPQPVMELLK